MRLPRVAALFAVLAATPALCGFEDVQVYMKGGKYAEAIRELNALIDTSGEWPDGHYLLGDCYLQTGKVDEAIAEYDKAIELNGDRFEYRAHLAQAYFAKKKDYGKTIAVLNEAEETAVGPQQKSYVNKYRGLSYAYLKNPQAAVANLKGAEPDKDPLVARTLGTACFQAGDYPCAIEHLGRAATSEPKNFDVAYYLARAHLISGLKAAAEPAKKGHYDKAFEAAKKAAALKPESVDAQATLAKAEIGAGRFGEAEAVFRALIKREPKDCTHYLDLLTSLREQEKWDALVEAASPLTGGAVACETKERGLAWTQVGFAWLKKHDKSLAGDVQTDVLTKSIDASKKAVELGGGSFAETNLKTAQENLRIHQTNIKNLEAQQTQIAAQLAECEKSLEFQTRKAAYLKETKQPDADGDGVADPNDACAGTPARALVDDKNGCPTPELKVCNDLLQGKT